MADSAEQRARSGRAGRGRLPGRCLPSSTAVAALAAGAPLLWDEAPGNLAYHFQQRRRRGGGAGDEAGRAHRRDRGDEQPRRRRADRAARRRSRATTPRRDTFDLELTGQGVHGIRRQLAEFVFKLPPERIRLHAPDVGGGFGIKNFLYPEWVLLLWAARELGRPVRWVAERAEEFVSSRAGPRHRARRARLALDADGRFLALDVDDGRQSRRLSLGQRPGQLDERRRPRAHGRRLRHPGDLHVDVRGAFTNTVPIDAYRGAGKPEANYLTERCIEARGAAARPRSRSNCGGEPDRRVPAPHGARHDDRLRAASPPISTHAVGARRPAASPRGAREAAARGRLRGLGVACFLETSRGAPDEGAEIRFETRRHGDWSRSARSRTARATRPAYAADRRRPARPADRRRSASSRPTRAR